MTIFDQLRTEIDELYELTKHDMQIYEKIIAIVSKSNELWRNEVINAFRASNNN